jgi:hypothetical protein
MVGQSLTVPNLTARAKRGVVTHSVLGKGTRKGEERKETRGGRKERGGKGGGRTYT